jgi:hypothetical protein
MYKAPPVAAGPQIPVGVIGYPPTGGLRRRRRSRATRTSKTQRKQRRTRGRRA